MNIWFCSDTHFGHENIIHYCLRPFQNSKEMENKIIKNLNHYVHTDDALYFLGDIGFGKEKELRECIQKINCKHKILILGNHDRDTTGFYYNAGFSAVLETASIYAGKHLLTLAHYPKKTYYQLFKLFLLYSYKMLSRKKTISHVIQRLKREWQAYKILKVGNYHIHGHTHSKQFLSGHNIHIGVDAHNFQPVSLKRIIQEINRHELSNSWYVRIFKKFF